MLLRNVVRRILKRQSCERVGREEPHPALQIRFREEKYDPAFSGSISSLCILDEIIAILPKTHANAYSID